MSWSTRDHTADVYLVAEGAGIPETISEAARGMLELVWDGQPPGPDRWAEVTLPGEGAADLMAELLTELLVRIDADPGWPVAVEILSVGERELHARIGSVARDPAARPEGREVKAVSRRDLELGPTPEGYRAVALLDL